MKKCRHLSPTQQLQRAHLCYSMPSCCSYACLAFHCRDPEEFPFTFFGGEWTEWATLFPSSTPSDEASTIPKQQAYHVAHLSHGSTSSVIWFGKFCLSPPVLNWEYSKYASQRCTHNMWQETSQTSMCWRGCEKPVVDCVCFRSIKWMCQLDGFLDLGCIYVVHLIIISPTHSSSLDS